MAMPPGAAAATPATGSPAGGAFAERVAALERLLATRVGQAGRLS
jgi:hypothetical protein